MFLSISIDLVGSTALKRAIFQAGNGDFDLINENYQKFVETMFEVEEALYRYVSESGEVDIRELFLAKIIGDEYWYLYEIDAENHEQLNEVAHAFIFGLLDVMASPRRLCLPASNNQEECFDLSCKALVDLITNALHLPDRRYAYFEDKISDLLGREARLQQAGSQDYSAICHALNVRPSRRAGQTGIGITRSDYVGMQVDRFFRAAKTCKPRLVTVGEALWDRLDMKCGHIDPSIDVNRTSHTVYGGKHRNGQCNSSCEQIPARQMTGIGHDYNVWHLYTSSTLREEIYQPNQEMQDFLAPTRAYLAKAGFYGIEREKVST
ncbi:MAG: hypothetical protein ACR2OR_09370 [Hyphomicrobiales bacterium]